MASPPDHVVESGEESSSVARSCQAPQHSKKMQPRHVERFMSCINI